MKPCQPHIFAVPAGSAFMREAVLALRANQLIDGVDMIDPRRLAQLRIYVPSKKAAQSLRSAFVETAENHAAFLPEIKPLGEEASADALIFAELAAGAGADGGDIETAKAALLAPAVIDPLERQALLARLIRPWREKLPRHIRALFGREEINIPANTADALWLARALSALMDEIETESADTAKIKTLAPEDLSEWWQVTVEFLDLIFAAWPDILAERSLTTAAAKRNRLLRDEAKRLSNAARAGAAPLGANAAMAAAAQRPILALGSTGSVPAAAELLKVIAYLPRGAVVLPGLDRDLEDAAWDALDADEDNPALYAHPQYVLKRLLHRMNISRENVCFLGRQTAEQRAREKAVSEIFRPAETTDKWQSEAGASALPAESFSPVSLIEAPNAREEALALACAMRAALERPGETAALITADRVLARRVAAELKRFNLTANDSGGAPLSETEPAALLKLLLAAIFAPGDAVAVLALLKHPLTRLGFSRADLRRQAEQLEFFALRGGTGRINIGAAEDFIEERLAKLVEAERVSSEFTADRLEEARRLAGALTAASAPLYRFAAQSDEVSLGQAVTATIETLENFGRDETGALNRLYEGEAGQKIISFFRALLANQSGLTFTPAEWPQLLEALMADQSVEMRQSGQPRLFILGLFEARLQNFDTVLIGGLNEGSLPMAAKSSPFMSRQMKAALGLPPPEQRIGFTAHDLSQNLAQKRVILSRALRVDNAPSVASRWLQRLLTVAGAEQAAAMRARGQFYARAARALDYALPQPFAARPCPKPALRLRPKSFSITEIETLRRDPYAVYARRILRLKPLEPLIQDAGNAERGSLIHAVLAAFGQYYPTENIAAIEPQATKILTDIAMAELAKLQLPADIAVLWQPRLMALIPNIIAREAALSPRRRYCETKAADTIIGASGCSLHGRADRIDILAEKGENGEKLAEIVDFKTGSSPDKKYARNLSAPQLALEGALLARSAFSECGKAEAEGLLYVRIKADGSVNDENIAAVKLNGAESSAAELSETAWQELIKLMLHFGKEQTGYLSHALPSLSDWESDYDHLAREFEWSALAGGREEE